MTESFDGAMASAPVAREGIVSVRGTHVFVPGSIVQIPPWAAPRMNLPFLRIASAPMRPLTSASAPSLRWIWMMGLGPIGFHAPANEAVAAAWPLSPLRIWFALPAAVERAEAAVSTFNGSSPAVRERT